MEMAVRSCKRAAQKLWNIHEKSCDEFSNVPVSYNGAYQKISGKGGGGFARCCFASSISIETGQVLSFEVVCNGCRYCVEKQQSLREKRMTVEDYRHWQEEYKKICQVNEFGLILWLWSQN